MTPSRLPHKLLPIVQRSPVASYAGNMDQIPHAQLRLALYADPALAALLPSFPGSFALGDWQDAPFRVLKNGLILLPPQWADDSTALALAARWGMEAFYTGATHASHVLAYGLALLDLASERVRTKFQALLPVQVGLEWLALRMPDLPLSDDGADVGELALPVESLLMAGGDSRLLVSPETGVNRYGVCPRPRPEAVHFSSSTASAVSDHGFLECDLIRRARPSRSELAGATIAQIREILELAETEVDVIITPSGTDTELLSVLLALAGTNADLVNVLIAPEESGKGVKLAGEGRYFDGEAKGQPAFPERKIQAVEIIIRDDDCRVRPAEDIWNEVQAGLQLPGHKLVHLLHVSKTGLTAPDMEVMKSLGTDTVDVVVDACQMRTSLQELGDLVKRGWMVQISGSKFFTGPPFSGAVLVPTQYRKRVVAVRQLLQKSPGLLAGCFWDSWWVQQAPELVCPKSYGPLFRWLPALSEAALYQQTDAQERVWAFEQFRSAVIDHFNRSSCLQPIDDTETDSDFAKLSIISFQVIGHGQVLNEKESAWLYENLNRDLAYLLPNMTEDERTIARLPCHIGQPVVLRDQLTYLRFVLGARFFNIVCHSKAKEAALASQIADARRVLTKIQWMASRWKEFRALMK